MTRYAYVFLMLTAFTAVLGFAALAGSAAVMARVLCVFFLLATIALFVFGRNEKPPETPRGPE